MDMNTLRVCHL